MQIIVKNVRHLDIRGNNLKEIPKTITQTNNATKMWISDNPYECNGDMLWMKNWLTKTESVVDKENVKCSTGIINTVVRFLQINFTSFQYLKHFYVMFCASWYRYSSA